MNRKIHIKSLCLMICCAVLLTCSGCKPDFSGTYGEAKRAVYEMRGYETGSGSEKIVNYREDYAIMSGNRVLGRADVILLNFNSAEDKIKPVCAELKEKLNGKKVPWLYVFIGGEKALDELSGLNCEDIGLIIEGAKSDYTPPINSIGGLTRLWITKNCETVPQWLGNAVNIRSLTLTGAQDCSNAPYLPELKELNTGEYGFEAATAYAFYAMNPQIETINGLDAKEYDFKANLNENELAYYNQAVQRFDVSRIDTSGFRVIPAEEAKLDGSVAVVGYGSAMSMNGFTSNVEIIPENIRPILTESPTERDTVVRVTTESVVVGRYTNGVTATGSNTYFEIINLKDGTITEKTIAEGASSAPSTVVREGSGSYSGTFKVKAAWTALSKLYDEIKG